MSTPSAPAALRPAIATDAGSIADVQIRSFRSTYAGIVPIESLDEFDVAAQREIWAMRIEEASVSSQGIVVAAVDDRVSAYIHYGPAADSDTTAAPIGHVFSVHTDPADRSAGLGSVLMEHATEAMRAAGFMEATLWVIAGNAGARRFYERLGWRANGLKRIETLGSAGEPGADIEVETVRYRLPLTQ